MSRPEFLDPMYAGWEWQSVVQDDHSEPEGVGAPHNAADEWLKVLGEDDL